MSNNGTEVDIEKLFAERGRLSTFTTGDNCVEVAPTDDGFIVVRHHTHHGQGHLQFTKGEMLAFLQGAKAGEFDDLVE